MVNDQLDDDELAECARLAFVTVLKTHNHACVLAISPKGLKASTGTHTHANTLPDTDDRPH